MTMNLTKKNIKSIKFVILFYSKDRISEQKNKDLTMHFKIKPSFLIFHVINFSGGIL